MRTGKQGSLRCGGKSAAFGRDDVILMGLAGERQRQRQWQIPPSAKDDN
jgi:hypothetical protein